MLVEINAGENQRRVRRDAVLPRPPAPPVRPTDGWYPAWKSRLEWMAALLLLLFTWPLILLAALVVKLTSRGPAFYSQTRLGKHGRPYVIWKLRTMYHNAEHATGPCWATVGDPRVTRVGRFLRATHLDELPQLWNVLRGEMSLVGPRPERPEFVNQLAPLIPRYRDRLLLLPGVTGLAQVQLPADTDLDSVRRKIAHDLWYLQRVGPWLDLCIVLMTACDLVGVPYALSRRFLPVPASAQIEAAYERQVAEEEKQRQARPA
jgi:lipopolysaccharide/colanic/teichoic acid biosynthesis glycosyltransferase